MNRSIPFAVRVLPALLGAGLILLAGCSPHREIYPHLDSLARQGRYQEAVRAVESSRPYYGPRNEVLYQVDLGTLLFYAGDYKKSNEAFQKAEERMDELFTKVALNELGSVIVNDNALPYRGEDFESVVINVYRALNYLMLRDLQAALVEARKVDEKLAWFNTKYKANSRNTYREDGFARLLAGMLYEMGGTRDDLNDAYISYRKAEKTYQNDFKPTYDTRAPELLASNLLTTAGFMGNRELEKARKNYPDYRVFSLAEKQKLGQAVFIHFAGKAPVKQEGFFQGMMPDGNMIRIVFPVYRRVPYLVGKSEVVVDGGTPVRLETGQPLGEIAIRNLDDRKGRIAVKAIARAALKYMANRALQGLARSGRDDGLSSLAYIAGNLATVATERADLRSWQILPDRILIGRALLRPGTHHLEARLLGEDGEVIETRDLGEQTFRAGETRFFILHSNL